MRVRWTTDAADDLERICDYVARERPEAAHRIALDVLRVIEDLRTFPNRGRPGRVQGTRELVLTRPFLAVYEVREQEVQVLRILHGARQWPSS
jgi:toxin ParE1/3/4